MSTIGELGDIDVEDLIEVFSRKARSGRLTIKTGGQEVHLYFEQGSLALVTSTDLTLRLGRMLIRQGLLDSTRLLEALHEQAEGEHRKSLGTILLERDWVTAGDLLRCVEEQSIDALARAVSGESGLFVFEPGVSRPAHVEAASLDAGMLLEAAHVRREALNLLRNELPADSVPLLLSHDYLGATGMTDDLGAPESMVTRVLKTGAKTQAELRIHLPLDELTLGATLLALIERGVVVPIETKTGGNGKSASRPYARSA